MRVLRVIRVVRVIRVIRVVRVIRVIHMRFTCCTRGTAAKGSGGKESTSLWPFLELRLGDICGSATWGGTR
jgi:hypothetical protein